MSSEVYMTYNGKHVENLCNVDGGAADHQVIWLLSGDYRRKVGGERRKRRGESISGEKNRGVQHGIFCQVSKCQLTKFQLD